MPTPHELAQSFRRELLQSDATALGRISGAYADSLTVILGHLDALQAERIAAEAAGRSVGLGFLYAQQRLNTLLGQVSAELDRFATALGPAITADQAAAVDLARNHATTLIQAQLPAGAPGIAVAFNRVPTGAVESLVGTLGDGSPLSALLAEIAPQGVAAAKRALVVGVATGAGPAQVARGLRDALGITLNRAQTISRQSILTSYRLSSLAVYAQNAETLSGWRWTCSRSSRTCPACLAQDGKVYPLSVQFFPGHVRCRCSPSPVTKTNKELGIDGPEPPPIYADTAADWFGRQDAATQERILGPSAYRAWSAGAITSLDQFVGVHEDPRWGQSVSTRSLAGILGEQHAARFKRAA